MPGRTIAIGDIHGCSIELARLLEVVAPSAEDTLVLLGDYIDRGIDSRGVIEQLLELQRRCTLVALMGNHEQMMLEARDDPHKRIEWMEFGGIVTLDSYGDRGWEDVPEAHWTFLRSCRDWHETSTHLFVHASYEPERALGEQEAGVLRWRSLHEHVPGPHRSGKRAIVGHTPQESGEILALGHLVCIDTGVCHGGRLTALDVESGRAWQVGAADGAGATAWP